MSLEAWEVGCGGCKAARFLHVGRVRNLVGVIKALTL